MSEKRLLVTHQYPEHHYQFWHKMTERFCPWCGVKGLWVEEGEGDYYAGPQYHCVACNSTAYLDGGEDARPEIIRQLSTGVTDEPTTPRGH